MKHIWIFLSVGILAVIVLNVMQHENVHREIFRQDGCKDITVTYGFTSITDCIDKTYKESSSARESQMMNEVIGYNNNSIILTMLVCTITILGYLTVKKNE